MTREDREAIYYALNMHASYIETGDPTGTLAQYQSLCESPYQSDAARGKEVLSRYARLEDGQRQRITYLRKLAIQVLSGGS